MKNEKATSRPDRRRFLTAGAALGGTVAAVNAVAQNKPAAKHKAVFHVTAQENIFNNLNNLMTAFAAGGVLIEVVFMGHGLDMLVKAKSQYADQLKEAADKGVKLSACQNTMRRAKVTIEDLFPFAGQVDSGVAELVRKQEAGWAYIRVTA